MKRTDIFSKISLLLFAACLALQAGLFAQSPYSNSPTAADRPDADVLVLKERIVLTLHPDGTVEEHVSRVEKVLTYEGMDMIGDPKVPFNKECQSLEIKKLRTFTPEGKTVDAKANSFTEMTPFELEKAPDFTSIRQMVVTKVGLDAGAVVEYEYVIADTRPWRKFMEGAMVLREALPVLEKEVEIRVPGDSHLKAELVNSGQELMMKKDAGMKSYFVRLSGLEPLRHRECTGGEEYLTPYLAYSTCPDWAGRASSISSLFSAATSGRSREIDAKTDELTEKAVTMTEKARVLHDFVNTKFRLVEWDPAAFDWAPRHCSKVYLSSYGNMMDKAVLLSSMLERAGMKPSVHLVMDKPRPAGTDGVPTLALFDSVVISLEADGRTLFLDPCKGMDEFSLRDCAGKRALVVKEGTASLAVMPMLRAPSSIRCKAILGPKEGSVLSGTAAVELSGAYANYEAAVKNGFDAAIISVLEGFLPQAGDIKVTPRVFESETLSGEASFTLDLKKGADKKKLFALLETAVPGESVILREDLAGAEQRSMPKIVPFDGAESYEVEFALPEGYAAFNSPREVSLDGGVSARQRTVKGEGGTTVSLTVTPASGPLQAKDYASARKAFSMLLSDACRLVVIEEAPKKK